MSDTGLPDFKLGQTHQGAIVIARTAVFRDRDNPKRYFQYVIYIEGDPGYYVLKCHKTHGFGGYTSTRVKESLGLSRVNDVCRLLVEDTGHRRNSIDAAVWPTQETFDAVR